MIDKNRKLTYILAVYIIFVLLIGMVEGGYKSTFPEWILPVETAGVHSAWFSSEETPPLYRVVDEATGRWCLEYNEVSPLKVRVFYTEFDRGLLNGHDTLRFRWKVMADNTWVQAQVSGYPESGREKRNYYLNKRPPTKGEWQEVWLDLNHDDDLGAGCSDAADGKVRVAFTVKLWDMGELSDPPHVLLRIADVRFERHPLRIECDLYSIENIEDGAFKGQRYPLVITNRSDQKESVRLDVDTADLKEFSVTFSEKEFDIPAGTSHSVTAEIKIPADRAEHLPPLYNEQAGIFASTEKHPEHITTWYHSFMLYRLVGAIPPKTGRYPRFKTDEECKKTTAGRDTATVDKSVERLLDIPIEPPELRHGYSGSYMDPGPPMKPLRFHGPGKHYSERTGGYVDINRMPEHVQKAAAFAHHSYLSSAAYTLADAWWKTGRKEFARRSADILLVYAERYPKYSLCNPYAVGYHSRVGHAMLGESWWFHRMPETFDLLRASGVITKEEEEKILNGLIIPAMITIRTHRVAANQQAEINASYGKAALAAERWDYAAQALDGEYGIRAQWRMDFDPDGFSMEKETGYHFAALLPFVEFANCLEAMGVDVYDRNFKKLFDAPITYHVSGRPPFNNLYLYAYRHYRDPNYLPLVASLLSPDELPQDADINPEYCNSTLQSAGYTILRTGNEKEGLRAITMNWGCPSHRGGNVLLNPLFIWKGNNLNEHVLRIGYGYGQSGFSYTAAAGNSIVRDGKSHSMLRAHQVALLGGDTPAGRWTSPLHRPLYAGVEWSRTAAVCGDSFVLIDQTKSDVPGRFDWFTYLPASIVAEQPEMKWLPYISLLKEGNGYDFLQSPEIADLKKTNEINFYYRLKEGKNRPHGQLNLISSASTLLRARGYVHWHPELVPLIIQRFEDKPDLWSIAVYTGSEEDIAKSTAEIKKVSVFRNGVKLSENDAIAVSITNKQGVFLVMTSRYPGSHTVQEMKLEGPLGITKVR
jgi:hypothetical protein